MSQLKAIAAVLSTIVLVSACSTASQNISSAYVSPIQYQSYDCEQLAQESTRILVRVKQLGVQLDQAAQNDKAIGVVGAVLFWPALFALGGTKQQEAEYGRLKGEYEAVDQMRIQKKCSVLPDSAQKTVGLEKDHADIANVDAVPFLNERGRQGYREWLTKQKPRAFVIAPDGTWNATWGVPTHLENESPDAAQRALSRCEKRAQGCKIYAVDQRVVWVPRP